MISTGLMWWLIANYGAIIIASLIEHNGWRALYFGGAIVISLAVLGMTDK